ncbi:MAG: gliding motility-associated C-terminal domain-containing protein [Paludibacteraceae bacterium]|nr:gliding motility-associated C-terminal domain-containing protein [Paludibacteraceae bacterium]
MKEFCRHFILFLFLSALSFSAGAQVTFNYDTIRICAGDSYDLLKYQTNEVVVPVGWEIVGWKNITNTTVTPTTSPTVYTLQYREKANPSVILTHDLTVSLRPKPTVSITPSGAQTICVGQLIHIKKVSAANYDNLYWIYVQKSEKYYTDAVDAIAVRGNTDNKMTYKLIATNNDCAVVAQDQIDYSVVKDDEYPIYIYMLNSNVHQGWTYSYCDSTYLRDYMTPIGIIVPTGSTGDMSYDPKSNTNYYPTASEALYLSPTNQYQKNENDMVRMLSYKVIWDKEDQYTQGAVLKNVNYSNKYTLEVALYFKACGTTKIYRSQGQINLTYHPCASPSLWIYFDCDEVTGKGAFGLQGTNASYVKSVKSITWENITVPGKYIPTGDINNYQYTFFDENAPEKMQYRATVAYEDNNGVIQQAVFTYTWKICYKKKVINYANASFSYLFSPYFKDTYEIRADGYFTNQLSANYTGKPTVDTVETTICLGSPAYFALASNVNGKQHVVWNDPERPVLVTKQNHSFYNYTYNQTSTGYEMLVDSIPCLVFKLTPSKTTVYTGTLEGLAFVFKVNVVNNHIAAVDTAICRGQSIDLKTLERVNNINGTVAWNVNNTLVTPTVDTKYTVYGIARDKCPDQTDYTITDNVTVHVDEMLWSTNRGEIASCAGDWLDLTEAINSNARDYKWYDSTGKQLTDGTVKIAGDTYYTLEMSNGCGTKTETIQVKETPGCYDYKFAQNDTLSTAICASEALRQGMPLIFADFFVTPLVNDGSPCDNPVVTIITKPTIPGTSAVCGNDKLYYSTSYANVIKYSGQKDSVQYEVRCQFKRDTAWAYFEIRNEQVLKLSGVEINADGSQITIKTEGITPSKANPLFLGFYSEDGKSYSSSETMTGETEHTFTQTPAFADGKYYISTYNMSTMCVVDDSIMLKSGKIIPYIISLNAINDSLNLTPCLDSVEVNILANDTFSCAAPVVKILNTPFTNATVSLTADNKMVYKPVIAGNVSKAGKTDTIRYSLACGSVVDTAAVYFKYPTSYSPWIEVNEKFNTKCFTQGDTLIQEINIKNNCTTTRTIGVDFDFSNRIIENTIIKSEIVSSSNVKVKSYQKDSVNQYDFYELEMDPNSEITLKGYFLITKVKGGWPNLSYYGSVWDDNNSQSSYIIAGGQTDTLYACPDRNFTVTDCASAQTLTLSQKKATAYRITQSSQLPGTTVSLSSTGILTYTPIDVSAITQDEIKYEMDMTDGSVMSGTVTVKILPCIDSIKTSTTQNDLCNDDLCNYTGPSILINEVMITPTIDDGAIYGTMCGSSANDLGGEWVELYNPDKCKQVDISGYFFANATADKIGNPCTLTSDLGAAFVIPSGTVVPPMGFCVLRGEHAEVVDSARLVKNGGNTVVINLVDHFDRFCMNNNGVRFWLPNAGGWFGFYNKAGVPQDAIYWGADTTTICPDCLPCNPQVAGSYAGQLVALKDFPVSRKTRISNISLDSYAGLSPKRQPDGGAWDYNHPTAPTMGYCNGQCNVRVNSSCNGTATATPSGGSGNFSYVWNDPVGQTTATATGLCEGTYCCTITDNDTKLTALTCVTVTDNLIKCTKVVTVNDTSSVKTCEASSIRIPILKNDVFSCTPTLTIVSPPILLGSTASIINDSLTYSFANITATTTDSVRYKVTCNGRADSAWVYVRLLNDKYNDSIKKIICKGQRYMFYGDTLTTGGTYEKTLSCDSTVTLILTVTPVKDSTITARICSNGTYNFNGHLLSATGIYRDTLRTTIGCDSLRETLTLTVTPVKDSTITARICSNGTYNFNGHQLNTTGIYKDTLRTTIGCDSLRETLNLMVKDSVHVTITAGLCAKGSYTFAGRRLNTPGTYSHTYPFTTGCDSVVTLILKKEMADTTYINAKINEGETYLFAGENLNSSGIYNYKKQTVGGCDSIIILNLSVDYSSDSASVVPAQGFSPNGDGINDYFEIANIEQYPKNHILIFNRWGNKVYEGKPYMNQWDGRSYFGLKVGGDLLPVGTYFYILDLGDGSKIKKGFVYLNR